MKIFVKQADKAGMRSYHVMSHAEGISFFHSRRQHKKDGIKLIRNIDWRPSFSPLNLLLKQHRGDYIPELNRTEYQ